MLHLVPEPVIFRVTTRRVAAHLPHRSYWNAQFVPDDGEGEHQDEDGEDELEGVHCALSPAGIRACSRNASICAAVCAPPSVTICSSTRKRASTRSVCCAYCALFSAARLVWASICFSLIRIHILNGAMPIAAKGMSTQIQLAILFMFGFVPVFLSEFRIAAASDQAVASPAGTPLRLIRFGASRT